MIALKELSKENSRKFVIYKGEKKSTRTYTWVNETDYKGFMPNRSECVEESDGKEVRFVSVSSLKADYLRVKQITEAGRMRWKIENGGFDIQKNHGYQFRYD